MYRHDNDFVFSLDTVIADDMMDEVLAHYGVSLASGRYPQGSGEEGYQRMKNLQTTVRSLRKAGMKDTEIYKHLQFRSTQELRARLSQSKEAVHAYEAHLAWKLKEKGMSPTAIAERMYKDKSRESHVRNLLKEAEEPKETALRNTAETLKKELDKHPYLQVGEGVELYLGVSETRLKTALEILKNEGYKVHETIQVPQLGTTGGEKTTVKVLTKDGVTGKEVYDHLAEVEIPNVYSEDSGTTYRHKEPPQSISSDRVKINYFEDGGIDKDGVIEIRPGVPDLSLGKANYAQVRIAVDDTHYLKGMAMYSDNIPPGYDVVFNTNKHEGTPKIGPKGDKDCVLKPLKDDPANPFGASIQPDEKLILSRQGQEWTDEKGEKHRSAINIVNEEGAWNDWSKTVSSQMLGKQPPALAKQQLDLTYSLKKQEFDDIMALTNPVVKKKMLEEFAESCDSAAVHLKAHGFPGQATKVLLPVTTLADGECYCPQYETGTKVALVRHPHGHISEIPILTVNNNHTDAKHILGNTIDAIGLPKSAFTQLSGADADGDTAIVIPNNDGLIKNKPYFDEMKNFEPKEAYRGYPGMVKMTKQQRGREMGIVSNLLTDMSGRASDEEIIKALKHSMVVIDAEKHGLDWRRSEKENDILGLKEKYQQKEDGTFGGAATLLSKAGSEERVEYRGQWTWSKNNIDPVTGKKIYTHRNNAVDPDTGEGYYDPAKDDKRFYYKQNKKGEWVKQERQTVTTKMENTDDARTLISPYNTQIERVYANYANSMKALANEARKAWLTVPKMETNAEAKQLYAKERLSLIAKLKEAKMNKPLERKAQILANLAVKQYLYEHPEVKNDKDAVKKLKGRTLQEKRDVVGASKHMVFFTPREWEAVQSGAVSSSMFEDLLNNAKSEHIKQLATPKERKVGLTPGQKNLALNMLKRYTQAEVAKELGVSVSTIQNLLKE